jgi:hypothetical protein
VRAGKNWTGNFAELPNTTFMVVICRVPNCNNDQTSSIQLQASYTDVRHRDELIDLIEQKLLSERTILSDWVIQMQLDGGRIGKTVSGIIRTGANNEWPSISPDFIKHFPF